MHGSHEETQWFTSLVRPHLEFGNVAWSPRLAKDRYLITGGQRQATKMVLALKYLEYEEAEKDGLTKSKI